MKIWLFSFVFLSTVVYAKDQDPLLHAMVRVIVHKQEMDLHEPWKRGKVYTEDHIGTIVRYKNGQEKGILIKASALSFTKRIEMQVLSQTELTELTPVFIDNEIDLALLKPRKGSLPPSVEPVEVSGKDIPFEQNLILYKADASNHVERIRCTLRNVNVGERSDTSAYPILNYMLKAPRKDLGWSEPIVSNGRLTALSVGEDEEDNVHAIPGTVIAHFLNDSLDEHYRGFPTLGIEFSSLASPHTRKALGLPGAMHGVLIHKVNKLSAFHGLIDKGDLILSIDGQALDTNGNFQHPLWGEIPGSALIYKHYSRDTVSIEVLRGRKKQRLSGKVHRYKSNAFLIPYYDFSWKIPYLVVGGLVFQELTRPYMRAWGKNWLGDAPSAFSFLWAYQNRIQNSEGERIIILNQVLADPINKGYESIANVIVDKVNEIPIHSMSDLQNALRKPLFKNGENFVRIQLNYGEGEVILGNREIADASTRIGNSYGIYDKDVFFVPVH